MSGVSLGEVQPGGISRRKRGDWEFAARARRPRALVLLLSGHEGQHAATLGSGIYGCRTAGGDRNHWVPDGAVASGGTAGAGIVAAVKLLKQHSATRLGCAAI